MHLARLRTFKFALVAGTALVVVPVLAADVTPERLANPSRKTG